MKHLSVATFLLFGIAVLSAQETKTLWQKDIQSSTQDFLSGMSVTIDRQILLSGSSIKSQNTEVGSSKNSGYDYHIVKLNDQGNKVWEKYFSGNRQDYLNSTISTQEGGFLLTGTSYSTQSLDKKFKSLGSSDIWMIKIDENGDEEWQQVIGTKYGDEARASVQALDLGYFVAGNSNLSSYGFGASDVMITRLDKNGKILNQIVLGGTGSDEVEKIIPTKDGGCLIGIYSQSGMYQDEEKKEIRPELLQNTLSKSENTDESGSSGQNSNSNQKNSGNGEVKFYGKKTENYGVGDYWIVKLDKAGNVEWEKNFGGTQDDHLRTLSLTENGYLIGGESRSETSGNKRPSLKEGTDLWLIALDENGNETGQYTYSFGSRDILMSLDVIRKTNKNNENETKGFLLGGYTQSEEKKQSDDETFWMLYIDKNGKEQWRKYVKGKSKKNEERLVSAKLLGDGTYLLAGTSAEQLGEENWKIVKLGDKDLDELIEKQDIRIYPNPVEDYCYVELSPEVWKSGSPQDGQEAEIFLNDMSGRQIQSIKTKQQVTKINTSVLPQGVYIVTAKTKSQTVNSKIVKK